MSSHVQPVFNALYSVHGHKNILRKKMNKNTTHNKLYMSGGVFSGLTSQTLRPLSCGSDRISFRNPARPHTNDRYA